MPQNVQHNLVLLGMLRCQEYILCRCRQYCCKKPSSELGEAKSIHTRNLMQHNELRYNRVVLQWTNIPL